MANGPSEVREVEKVRDALWGFVLGGQLRILQSNDDKEKRQLEFIGKTCTPEMFKLAWDFPVGTQFDIFIRKRE